MTELNEYGAGLPDRDPPWLERKVVKQSPHNGKLCGFICFDHTERRMVYASGRSPRGHHYRKLDAYALSETIISELKAVSPSAVIIYERQPNRDDGDVYEFAFSQYRDGPEVPYSDLVDKSDPQRYVPLDGAMEHWPDAADELFIRPFRSAMDRIGWRGYDPHHPAKREQLAEHEDYP